VAPGAHVPVFTALVAMTAVGPVPKWRRFLVAGMLNGVGGTVAGSAFGLLLIWVQNTYKIIRLAGDVYQISYLPMKLTGSDFAMIVGSTLVISFLATLSPARRAARMDPIEVLRYE
jgi:lipoprotein-releasing system permease protein